MKCFNRYALPFVMSIVASLLSIASPTMADIVHCQALEEPGPKVLLDDLKKKRDFSKQQRGALVYELSNHLLQLELESDDELEAFHCPNRWPITHQDWDRETVRDLYERSVAIEMWIWPPADENSNPSIGYLLVPLHHQSGQSSTGVVVIQGGEMPRNDPKKLVAWLDQSGRIAAYAHASTGVRLMRSREWDAARKYLCSAQSRLAKLHRGRGEVRDGILLKYVSELAETVVVQALEDPAYKGALRITKESRCPLTTL